MLAAVVVQADDVGEVLVALAIGVPVAALLGVRLQDSWRWEGLGNLFLGIAGTGALGFLMLGCQALTNTGI